MGLRSIFALTAAVVAIAVAPAAAITGGTPDSATSPLYPEVVAIGYPPPPDAPPEEQGLVFQSCTATLVADTVAGQARLLTAGHCAAPPDVPLHVSFAADAPPDSSSWISVAGTVIQQPGAGHDRGDLFDLGVVAIPASIVPAGTIAATLPATGALSALRRGDRLVVVGYGCERLAQNGGFSNLICGTYKRRYTTSLFQALRPSTLVLNSNTAAGSEGGICYADSGGPVFEVGDTPPRAVLGTASGGNPLCNATSYHYRTDTPEARAFLASQGVAAP
jgi:hypothetical protein